MICATGSPGTPWLRWWPRWRRRGPGPATSWGDASRIALREPGRRAEVLDGQLERLDELIVPVVTARALGLLALYGVGPNTAALLLIAAGDHPGRLRSEAAWAHLCGVAPILPSSGKTVRHRLNNPAGDRQASHALWRIVFTRAAPRRPPAPTPNAASPKENPRRRSSAVTELARASSSGQPGGDERVRPARPARRDRRGCPYRSPSPPASTADGVRRPRPARTCPAGSRRTACSPALAAASNGRAPAGAGQRRLHGQVADGENERRDEAIENGAADV
jgi:hypothetical protein